MRITPSPMVRLAQIAVAGILMTAPVVAQSGHPDHVGVSADKMQWGPAPPFLPPGAEITVLEGNPHEKGPVTLRLRFPANYNIAPHWHSMAEAVTVISGTFDIGMGDTLNRQSTQRLEPGGFVLLPAKMHHYAWTSVPTVVQINLEGPFDIFYVNAADDPQQQLTRR